MMSKCAWQQVRKQQGQGPSGGQWFSFDDNTVEPWDISKLDDECFGGRESESRAARGLPSSPRPLGVSTRPVCKRCLEISMALLSRARRSRTWINTHLKEPKIPTMAIMKRYLLDAGTNQ